MGLYSNFMTKPFEKHDYINKYKDQMLWDDYPSPFCIALSMLTGHDTGYTI